MPTQPSQENSVQELTKHYASIMNRVGESSMKEILLGAKRAAKGIMYPEESKAALELYEAVEKNLFGQGLPLQSENDSQTPKEGE